MSMFFDEEKKMWCYIDEKSKSKKKTIIYIKEHFPEKGPTFSECLMNAFLYEARQLEIHSKLEQEEKLTEKQTV